MRKCASPDLLKVAVTLSGTNCSIRGFDVTRFSERQFENSTNAPSTKVLNGRSHAQSSSHSDLLFGAILVCRSLLMVQDNRKTA